MSQCRHLQHAFYEWDETTLILNVLGTPAAKKTGIGQPLAHQLKISVTASPVHGAATDFMVAYLSGIFDVRIKDIEVVFGRTSIHKQLRIHNPQQLPSMIAWPSPALTPAPQQVASQAKPGHGRKGRRPQ